MDETILKALLFVRGYSDKKVAEAQGSGATPLTWFFCFRMIARWCTGPTCGAVGKAA